MRQSSSGGTHTRFLASPGAPPTRKSRALTAKWLSSMSKKFSLLFFWWILFLLACCTCVFGISFFWFFFWIFLLNCWMPFIWKDRCWKWWDICLYYRSWIFFGDEKLFSIFWDEEEVEFDEFGNFVVLSNDLVRYLKIWDPFHSPELKLWVRWRLLIWDLIVCAKCGSYDIKSAKWQALEFRREWRIWTCTVCGRLVWEYWTRYWCGVFWRTLAIIRMGISAK